MFDNFFQNRPIDEIMWKDIVELERPQMIIWYMRVARRIPKATNTCSENKCNAYCFSIAPTVAQTHLIVTLYVHRVSCLSRTVPWRSMSIA